MGAGGWEGCWPHTPCFDFQVDKRRFVQRAGAQLVLEGKRFEFAGASNYYMMTRAIDSATRPQVCFVQISDTSPPPFSLSLNPVHPHVRGLGILPERSSLAPHLEAVGSPPLACCQLSLCSPLNQALAGHRSDAASTAAGADRAARVGLQ